MPSADWSPSHYAYAPPRRSRVVATALSLALIALVVLVLIQMGVIDRDEGPSGTGRLISVRIGSADSTPKKQAHTMAPQAAKAAPKQPQPEPHPVATASAPPSYIHLSRQEFAAADISKMAHTSHDSESAAQTTANTYGPGEGPGGAHVFNAEWYHRPTDAQMRPYMPRTVPGGSWAVIECRMIADFHVDDCQELGESPPGSGLSRGLRQASWQFLVRPPRVNGIAQLGVRVRIHYDFVDRASPASGDGDAPGDR